MVKKFLVFSLVAIIVIAVGISAYNVFAGSADREGNVTVSSDPVSVLGDNAFSNVQENDPAAGAAAQGSSRQAGSATQDTNWQGQTPAVGGGQGGRYGQGGSGQGQGAAQGAGTQTGVPNPQAAQKESITLRGVISNFVAPNFTLITDDGQTVAVQLGNQRYVSDLGMVLQDGDAVTVVGFYETSDSIAVSTLTLDANGQAYTLRDQATGRPMWAGGPKNH